MEKNDQNVLGRVRQKEKKRPDRERRKENNEEKWKRIEIISKNSDRKDEPKVKEKERKRKWRER